MRRLFMLFIVLIACVQAQDNRELYFTKGEPNGVLWRGLSDGEKSILVMGAGVGKGVVFFLDLANLPMCSQQLATSNDWSRLTNGAVAKEVDAFYDSRANVRLPISVALVHVFMKLNGASEKDLETFRVKIIEIYTDIGK